MKTLDFFPAIKSSNSCDLCNSKKFQTIIKINGRVMTSDQQIQSGQLYKIECVKCGLVRTKQFTNNLNLKNKYNLQYTYNTNKNSDIRFFTYTGSMERSSLISDWILSILPKNKSQIKKIIEIGCGEGNLLIQLSKKFPHSIISGYEVNRRAIKIGKSKGLNINHIDKISNEKADLVISFAVMEHTKSPKLFLNTLKQMMAPGGILVIGCPHQDKLSYDIFFTDHLFHFSIKHLENYGKLTNLKLVKKSSGKWPLDSFALCCYKQKTANYRLTKTKTKVRQSVYHYNQTFQKLNQKLEKIPCNQNLAVYGLGEMFTLLYTYSRLHEHNIHVGIDDYPKDRNYTFPVVSTKLLRKIKLNTIIVCVNPNYYTIVKNKLKNIRAKILFPFNHNFDMV